MTAQSHAYRDVSTAHSQDVPRDLLQSLLVTELLKPSRPLWIVSPWISNLELIDNSARQFNALFPGWPARRIRLHTVIEALLNQGGAVQIVTSQDTRNDGFIRELQPLARTSGERFRIQRHAELHTKGIVGERFILDGSMNLTHSGVYRNEEHITYRTDPELIYERRLELTERWDHAE